MLRDEVDSFMPGKRIPHCHLKAKFSGDLTAIPDLECDIDVLGARQPHNKFAIDFTPSVEAADYPPGFQPPSIPASSSAIKRSAQTGGNLWHLKVAEVDELW